MGRDENITVFNDTKRLYETNKTIKENLTEMIKMQELILEADSVKVDSLKKYGSPAKVVVSAKRTLEAAKEYVGEGPVAILNFASATNPGGGVVRGAGAQEECICRCTSLYPALAVPEFMKKFYEPHRNAHNPIYNDDSIYTKEVLVFKSDTVAPKLLPEEDWYKVNVITTAAPNINACAQKGRLLKNKEIADIHEKRIRRILDIAVSKGNETIILGAYGCGAFGNPPEVVADTMNKVTKDYLYAFRNIEFAVYCPPKNDTNYQVFRRKIAR